VVSKSVGHLACLRGRVLPILILGISNFDLRAKHLQASYNFPSHCTVDQLARSTTLNNPIVRNYESNRYLQYSKVLYLPTAPNEQTNNHDRPRSSSFLLRERLPYDTRIYLSICHQSAGCPGNEHWDQQDCRFILHDESTTPSTTPLPSPPLSPISHSTDGRTYLRNPLRCEGGTDGGRTESPGTSWPLLSLLNRQNDIQCNV
jgi:hypothetical protein